LRDELAQILRLLMRAPARIHGDLPAPSDPVQPPPAEG
jgi:hypothetical protein